MSGIQLPKDLLAVMQKYPEYFAALNTQKAPTINVAEPMNDTQVLASVAATVMARNGGIVGRALDEAAELIEGAFERVASGQLQVRLDAAKERARAWREAYEAESKEQPADKLVVTH